MKMTFPSRMEVEVRIRDWRYKVTGWYTPPGYYPSEPAPEFDHERTEVLRAGSQDAATEEELTNAALKDLTADD